MLGASTTGRDGGVISAQADNDVDLLVYIVVHGAGAPTVGTAADFVVAPGQTLSSKAFNRLNDVYIIAAATTAGIGYKVTELIGSDVEGLLAGDPNIASPGLETIYLLQTLGANPQPYVGIGFDAFGKATGISISVPTGGSPVAPGAGCNRLDQLLAGGSYTGIVALVLEAIPVSTTKYAGTIGQFAGGMGKVYAAGSSLDVGPINADFAPSTDVPLNSAGQLPIAVLDASGVQADVFGGSSVDTGFAGLVGVPTQKTLTQNGTGTGGLTAFGDGIWNAISLDITSTGTGVTFNVETSNDGTHFSPVPLVYFGANGPALVPFGTTPVINGVYFACIAGAKYVRINLVTYTSGTFTAIVHLSTSPSVPIPLPVAKLANSQNAASSSTTPL